MTAIVSVRQDPLDRGVKVYLGREVTGGLQVSTFNRSLEFVSGEAEPKGRPLYLEDDEARALYEQLADHYGHSGHDTRALRRDYDAERKRVDLLMEHLLMGGGQ